MAGPPDRNLKINEEKNITKKSVKLKSKSNKKADHKHKELNKHRTNICEVMLWSNATPIRRNGDMGYMCCYCNSEYLQPADLKKHTLQTHKDVKNVYFLTKLSMDRYFIKLDITGLECNICNRNINTIEDLMQHLKADHDKIIHTEIKNHIIPFKFNSDVLQCHKCPTTFIKFKKLQEHMHLHYRNFVCDICNSGYFNSSSLMNHKLTHGTGTYKCEHCTQIFDTITKKRQHEQKKHSDKPLVSKCGYCNEIFTDFRKKEAHLVSQHGLKVLTPKCQACNKVYSDRNKLHIHIKRVHLMEKPHKCTECDMSFCSAAELRIHTAKHTGLKVYKCTVCSKAFCRSKTLKEHMKIHDDVRRFKCEHCGQAFVQKCSWRGHMRSKHGEIV